MPEPVHGANPCRWACDRVFYQWFALSFRSSFLDLRESCSLSRNVRDNPLAVLGTLLVEPPHVGADCQRKALFTDNAARSGRSGQSCATLGLWLRCPT